MGLFKKILLIFFIAIFFNACGGFKRSDVKDNPVGVNERVERNIKEGRGVRFGKLGKGSGGTFDFASSNELWRASMNVPRSAEKLRCVLSCTGGSATSSTSR